MKMAQIQHFWGPKAATHACRMNPSLFIISHSHFTGVAESPLGLDDTANPLISDWYKHTYIHRHITQHSALFSQTLVRRYSLGSWALLATGLTGCVCYHFGCKQALHSLAVCLMKSEVKLKLPCRSCHDRIDWWSVIDLCVTCSKVKMRPNSCSPFDSQNARCTLGLHWLSRTLFFRTTCHRLVTNESNFAHRHLFNHFFFKMCC